MSDYMFGVGRGKVSVTRHNALNRIAKKHGGAFVNTNIPGNGYTFWFAVPNYGSPHDQKVASEIITKAQAAKLWPIGS